MPQPIRPSASNFPSNIERAMDFSPSFRVQDQADSITSSSAEGGLCCRLFNFIANFFRRIFYFPPAMEVLPEARLEEEELLEPTPQTVEYRGDLGEKGAGYPATMGYLSSMGNWIMWDFMDAGDLDSFGHIRLLRDPVTKMVEKAQPNSMILIKDSTLSRNGRYISYKIEISSQGEAFNPLEADLDSEGLEDFMQFWTINYERDEENRLNKLIINKRRE